MTLLITCPNHPIARPVASSRTAAVGRVYAPHAQARASTTRAQCWFACSLRGGRS